MLLAAAVPRGFHGPVIDAGAGVGTVGLRIAQASPQATVTLIENDPFVAALASGNTSANGLADRASVAGCDLLSREARQPHVGKASLVVTNPPFHRAERIRISPDEARRAAHVLAGSGPEAWLDACLALLAPKGTLILIHQASALPEILARLGHRLGDVTTLAIHPRAGEPASRVLVRGTKGSRAPFRIASPLVLHEGSGFTAEAARLHAGVSSLVW